MFREPADAGREAAASPRRHPGAPPPPRCRRPAPPMRIAIAPCRGSAIVRPELTPRSSPSTQTDANT